MKQALISIVILSVCYFLLSGMFISDMSNLHSDNPQTNQVSLQPNYFATHNSLIITSNQGVVKVQNSLPLYDKIYITQNVTDIQNSILRANGIQLLSSLEQLLDVEKMRSSRVDRYELIWTKQEDAQQVSGIKQQNKANKDEDIKQTVEQILQSGNQKQEQSLQKISTPHHSIPKLLIHHYPFLPLLINSQFLSSLLATVPHHQKLLFLPRFISDLLSIECIQYDGITVLNRKYSIDYNNETQLYEWLEKVGRMGNKEKCGIRLDNKLVIGVMRRQQELRKLILGQQVAEDSAESQSQSEEKQVKEVEVTQEIQDMILHKIDQQQVQVTQQRYEQQPPQTQVTQSEQPIQEISLQQSQDKHQQNQQPQADQISDQNQSTEVSKDEQIVPIIEEALIEKVEEPVQVIESSQVIKVEETNQIDHEKIVSNSVEQPERKQYVVIEEKQVNDQVVKIQPSPDRQTIQESKSDLNQAEFTKDHSPFLESQIQAHTTQQPPSELTQTTPDSQPILTIKQPQEQTSEQNAQKQSLQPIEQNQSEVVEQINEQESESVDVKEQSEVEVQEEDKEQNNEQEGQTRKEQKTEEQETKEKQVVQQQVEDALSQSNTLVQSLNQQEKLMSKSEIQTKEEIQNIQQSTPVNPQVENAVISIESSSQQQIVNDLPTQQTVTTAGQLPQPTHQQTTEAQKNDQEVEQKVQIREKESEQKTDENQQVEVQVSQEQGKSEPIEQKLLQTEQEQLKINTEINQNQQIQTDRNSEGQTQSLQQQQQAVTDQESNQSSSQEQKQSPSQQQERHQYPTNPAFQTPLTEQGLSAQQLSQPVTPLAPHQPQTPLQFSPQQPPLQNNLLPQLQNQEKTLLEHTFEHQRKYPLPKQPSFDEKKVNQESKQIKEDEAFENSYEEMNFDDLAQTMNRLILAGYEDEHAQKHQQVEVIEQM